MNLGDLKLRVMFVSVVSVIKFKTNFSTTKSVRRKYISEITETNIDQFYLLISDPDGKFRKVL